MIEMEEIYIHKQEKQITSKANCCDTFYVVVLLRLLYFTTADVPCGFQLGINIYDHVANSCVISPCLNSVIKVGHMSEE